MGKASGENRASSPESAAHYVAGGGETTPRHEESYVAREARSKAEESRLVLWAAEHGKLGGTIFTPEDRGGEHTVAYVPRSNRYFKATRPDAKLGFGLALTDSGLGATPAEYLDRLGLNNQYFRDDVRIERVVVQSGKPIIVTSQPQISGPPATPRQIIAAMEEGGFISIAPGAFYHRENGVLAFDIYPKNVKSVGQVAVPIDPVLQRATPEFAEFIRQNYRQLPDFQNAEAYAWDTETHED